MKHADIILPIIILLMTYGVKLLVDQKASKVDAILSFCELPIDMVFLSISFLVAIIISDNKNRNDGIIYVFIFFVLTLFSVFLARRSKTGYEARKNNLWILLLTINLMTTIMCLRMSIIALTETQSQKEQAAAKTQLQSTTSNYENK